MDAVGGRGMVVEGRTEYVHIGRLRKALKGEDGADLIRTVRSAGNALEKPLS